MKDEIDGKIIIMREFATLRPQTYKYSTDDNDKNKKNKRNIKVCHKMKT